MRNVHLVFLAVCFIGTSVALAIAQSNQLGGLQKPLQESRLSALSSNSVCEVLHGILPGQVLFRDDQEYQVRQRTYWSLAQSELLPSCRISPQSNEALGTVLNKLQEHNVRFAIHAGGHSTVAGASNVLGDGVTIDLQRFSDIDISSSQVVVGSAATWGNVYSALEGTGKIAIGGRVASVGLGGLLLGGGISYLSSRHGWACESVTSYDIVLSNGSLVTTSASSNGILFGALKGSGVQFGIITSMTLRIYDQPTRFSYQSPRYNQEQIPKLIEEFVEFNRRASEDVDAYCMISLALNISSGATIITAQLIHAGGNPESEILRPLRSLDNNSEATFVDIGDLAEEAALFNPRGLRHMQGTVTTSNNADLIKEILCLWRGILDEPWALGLEFFPGLAVEAITQRHLHHASATKLFGLEDEEEPLVIFLIDLQYFHDDGFGDDYFGNLLKGMITQFERIARRYEGGWKDFTYLPYAAKFQSPIQSYGPASNQRLRDIQAMYDPGQVFTRLLTIPDGFKI